MKRTPAPLPPAPPQPSAEWVFNAGGPDHRHDALTGHETPEQCAEIERLAIEVRGGVYNGWLGF